MGKPRNKQQLHKNLEKSRKEYERVKTRIRTIGFICEGSLVERWTVCGKPNCPCRTDLNLRHGPYYQISWKEKGKTVSYRLSPEEAKLYQQWIENRQELNTILHKMKVVSRKAQRQLLGKQLKLKKPGTPPATRHRYRKGT